MRLDKDFVWEGEYGRREHLAPVFRELLKMQKAHSLQMLSLFVNNVPYNLEFFVGASYDRPGKDDMDEMKRLFEDAGLRYRQDLTLQKLFQKMGSRRFDSYAISEEADVDIVMKNAFVFAEISDLEKKGYGMSPFGKEKQVFISHNAPFLRKEGARIPSRIGAEGSYQKPHNGHQPYKGKEHQKQMSQHDIQYFLHYRNASSLSPFRNRLKATRVNTAQITNTTIPMVDAIL